MFREKQKEVNITTEELREFESKVSEEFEKGNIRGPVHLSYGNESYLIKLFEYVNPNDWVFSTWRNHYHALLHGVDKDKLFSEILNGKSISFQSPENRFYTSAIVGGIIPIAVGTAYGLKLNNVTDRMVWCFVGDMAAESGTFYEALKYSVNNELPIHFVIEDNNLSTNTPTDKAWGGKKWMCTDCSTLINHKYVSYFKYTRDVYPHVGIGKWIHF